MEAEHTCPPGTTDVQMHTRPAPGPLGLSLWRDAPIPQGSGSVSETPGRSRVSGKSLCGAAPAAAEALTGTGCGALKTKRNSAQMSGEAEKPEGNAASHRPAGGGQGPRAWARMASSGVPHDRYRPRKFKASPHGVGCLRSDRTLSSALKGLFDHL